MSFFSKLKNTHIPPPAPPRRIDNGAAYGWSVDGCDEDGDTYEAPPCERPAMKVFPGQVEENVYLERTSTPPVLRQAAPPPRPIKAQPGKTPKPEPQEDADDTYIDPSANNPPQVNRKDKPGKKTPPKQILPPRPAQGSASLPEEDVYLDPNEGQDDELYLEPNPAQPPSPRVVAKPTPPFPASAPRGGPLPMTKPPIPRAKSKVDLPSDGQEARRTSFPIKVPPLTSTAKPPLPSQLKEPKPSPPIPRALADSPGANHTPPRSSFLSGPEEANLQGKEWFAGSCDRKTAEAVLHKVKKDGAFLVRLSSAQTGRQPYTLVVLYQGKVYNIPVRYLEDSRRYALGKEGKRSEEFFETLSDIISHHTKNPLLLIDSKSQTKNTTYLAHPARP